MTFTIDSISIGGARLVGPLTLARDERVRVLFELDGRPLDVGAEVIRVESQDLETDRVALRFIDVPPETRALIRDLVLRTLELEAERQDREELRHVAGDDQLNDEEENVQIIEVDE